MSSTVRTSKRFKDKLERLRRKYPKVDQSLAPLLEQLRNDERPGDKIPGVGYTAFKVRLPNLSARRGKSGGFRTIYYVESAREVVLIVIYSKTEQTDIAADVIREAIEEDRLASLPAPTEPPLRDDKPPAATS